MSYPQFGYTTQLVVGNSGPSSPVSCCDGRPAAATSPRLLSACPRLTAGFYGTTAYPSAADTATAYGVESASFYPALNPAYPTMKDGSDPWRAPPTSYYYDPTLSAAYGYSGFDFNATRRKNVTRDSTTTLKAWLNEHRKNPYPTKGEKIMLAIITKMTLTQVSTWFANARRRLKKENKMTWEPRNKMDDDEKNSDDGDDVDTGQEKADVVEQDQHLIEPGYTERALYASGALMPPGSELCPKDRHLSVVDPYTPNSDSSSPDPGEKEVKPKIWSLADTATSKTEAKDCPPSWFHRPGLYSSAPPQTDTPPQTPPNMHHGSSMAYLSTPYLTQCANNPIYTAAAYTCMSVHDKPSGLYPVSYRTEYPMEEYQ